MIFNKFAPMKTIDVSTLKKRMDAGEAVHLVDVREPNEHDEFNIGDFCCLLVISELEILNQSNS